MMTTLTRTAAIALAMAHTTAFAATSWQPSDVYNALRPDGTPREYTMKLYGENMGTTMNVHASGVTEGMGDWHKEKHTINVTTKRMGQTTDMRMLVRVFQGNTYIMIDKMDMTMNGDTMSMLSADAYNQWGMVPNDHMQGESVVPGMVAELGHLEGMWNDMFTLQSTKHSSGYTHKLQLKDDYAQNYWQHISINPMIGAEDFDGLAAGSTELAVKADTSNSGEFYFGRIYLAHHGPSGHLTTQIDTQNHGAPVYVEVPSNTLSLETYLMHAMKMDSSAMVPSHHTTEPEHSMIWEDEMMWEKGMMWEENSNWDEWDDSTVDNGYIPPRQFIWIDEAGDVHDTRMQQWEAQNYMRDTATPNTTNRVWEEDPIDWQRSNLYFQKATDFENRPITEIYGEDRNALRFAQRATVPTQTVPNRNSELEGNPRTFPGLDRDWNEVRNRYRVQRYNETGKRLEEAARLQKAHSVKSLVHKDVLHTESAEAVDKWIENDVLPFFRPMRDEEDSMLHAVYEWMDYMGNIKGAVVHRSIRTTNGSWKHYLLLLQDSLNRLPGVVDFLDNTKPSDVSMSMFDPYLEIEPTAGMYKQYSEEFHLPFDNRGWTMAYENPEKNTMQYVLPNETLRDWTELVTVQHLYGTQLLFSADAFATTLAPVLTKGCEEVEWSIVETTEDRAIYEWWGDCVSGFQHEVGLVLAGQEAIYLAAYTTNGDTMYDGLRTVWLENLMTAEVNLMR